MSERVKITSADFNGHSWDGNPFDPAPAPQWCQHACAKGLIAVEPGSEDYAWWRIQTPNGFRIAGPGDEIICHESGTLGVRYADDSALRRFGHKYGLEHFQPTGAGATGKTP